MAIKPAINVHCHLLNFKCLPDKMVKLLSHIPEKLADDEWFAVAAGILFAMVPGQDYDRMKQFLRLFRKDLPDLAKAYNSELDNIGIQIFTPLMMDLEQATPNPGDVNLPYESQVDVISGIASDFPWQMFPFVMFDPRRENADTICIQALQSKGFLGIKMYPALGYSPDPAQLAQNNPAAAERLTRVYEFCGDNQIPITTHASVGGAYSTKKGINVEKNVWPFTEISNWLQPLSKYCLKLNFAHLGGNYLHRKSAKRLQSATWRREIINLIRWTRADDNSGLVFGDLSYHDMALKSATQEIYFNDLRETLNDGVLSQGILFGTDFSMISHTWSEDEFANTFRFRLVEALQEKIFFQNPISFLFCDAKVPDRYLDFLHNTCPDALVQLPDWIERRDDGYYIVRC